MGVTLTEIIPTQQQLYTLVLNCKFIKKSFLKFDTAQIQRRLKD